MGVKSFLKRIFRGGGVNPEADHMKYCYEHGFRSGKNFNYYSGYPIDGNWPWLISVGDDVTFASNVRILAHDASTYKAGIRCKIGIVKIGNNVFIGADSVVLCNVRIGDNVIVGANAVVTRDLPSNGVYAGNPARYICSFEEWKVKHQEESKKRPHFGQHANQQEWIKATPEEWQRMREALEDGYGYL